MKKILLPLLVPILVSLQAIVLKLFRMYGNRKISGFPLRVYNLGLGKTGTTSIAGILRNYNAVHEHRFNEIVPKIIDWENNIITRNNFVEYIVTKEEKRNLPVVDSSGFIHYYADILLENFPNAKFILTARDVESWFISDVNNLFNHYYGLQSTWRKGLFDIRIDNKYPIFKELSKKSEIKNHLIETLLNTDMIKDFLRYYYDTNLKIINLIPGDKLLIINTNNISSSIKDIAKFCEVPESELLIKHSNRNVTKHNEDYFNCLDNSDVANKFDELLITFKDKRDNLFKHSYKFV